MSEPHALTVQLLEWLDEQPRSYADTIERWKTSCPRLSIWEDAVSGGFVRVAKGLVRLTDDGRRLTRRESPEPTGVALTGQPLL